MNCEQCVKECKAEGGKCNPLTGEEWSWYEPWMIEDVAHHKHAAHAMVLFSSGFHRCEKGHKVEAHPADAMRAAGMEPMLMTTDEAIKVIEHAPDYPEAVVKQAVREGLRGEHGIFVQQVLLAIHADTESNNAAT